MKNKKIFFPKLIISDFDGCLTDDRVWLNEHGEEFVAANRKDGLGIKIGRASCRKRVCELV